MAVEGVTCAVVPRRPDAMKLTVDSPVHFSYTVSQGGRLQRSALLLIVLVTGSSISARAHAQSPASEFSDRYQALVEAYRSGEARSTVNAVLQLEWRAVTRAAEQAMRLARDKLRTDSKLDPAFFRAASLLHADAAFHCWRTGRDEEARSQFELASRLVDASEPAGSPPGAFRPRWYIATALVASTLVAPDDAFDYFGDAVKALPEDVPLLVAAGWFSERLAHRPAERFSEPRNQHTLQRRYLQSAERYLTRALEADPNANEAALRLARVEIAKGQDARARGRLVPLLARAGLEPSVRYLGRLLLGGIHEREGNAAEAQRLYREAIALDPLGQSARVALSHLLYASGDSPEAADAIAPLLTRRAERERNDPWSEYLLAYFPIGRALLDDLRKAVQR